MIKVHGRILILWTLKLFIVLYIFAGLFNMALCYSCRARHVVKILFWLYWHIVGADFQPWSSLSWFVNLSNVCFHFANEKVYQGFQSYCAFCSVSKSLMGKLASVKYRCKLLTFVSFLIRAIFISFWCMHDLLPFDCLNLFLFTYNNVGWCLYCVFR